VPKLSGYWFPPRERSLATSFFDGAAKLGPAIGVPVMDCCCCGLDGGLSFAATGVASLLYSLLFWGIYHDPPHKQLAGAPAEGRSARCAAVPLGYLLRRRKVIGLAVGFGSYNYVFYLLLTWLPV